MIALLISLIARAAPTVDDVASSAQWHLDHQPALERNDCSGLVLSILDRAGVAPEGSNTASLWSAAQDAHTIHPTPEVGDLVFFDNTYDRNRNGRVDDPLSHIAVVVSIDSDATVHMVHRGSRGIAPLVLNTEHPAEHQREGKEINSFLRAQGGAEVPRLAGQLLRGFARPIAEPPPAPPPLATSSPHPLPHATPRAWPPEGLLEVQARDGLRLRGGWLHDADCDELWRVRNTLFARHGYRFQTADARSLFASRAWYQPSDLVDASTIDRFLAPMDLKNLKRVQRLEERLHCLE